MNQFVRKPHKHIQILATIIDQLSIDIVPFTPDLEDRVDGHILGAIVGNDSTGLLDYILDGRVDTVAIPFHDYDYGFSEGKMFDVSAPIYNVRNLREREARHRCTLLILDDRFILLQATASSCK